MNPRTSFIRKIAYLAAIGVLLGLLYLFGHPSTIDTPGGKGLPGGLLAQARQQYGLSQIQLGQIDPTSETIKLATFGMRGVASLILWEKANDYKMKEDWANFAATLNQIIIVEPHFISVWIHQAWNMSYNVSVEFDDYRERYRWVIKGINYLIRGTSYNKNEPRLVWEVAWVIAQKIGRADEHKQYRRLFKADDEFHESRPPALRDNWLVGKQWFQEAIDLAERLGKGVGGKSPVLYLSDPAMAQMNYADAIETEGTFGEVARREWKRACDEWLQYGSLPIPSSYGVILYLNDQEKEAEQAKEKVAQLDAMQPGLREEIRKKKYDALTEKQQAAYQLYQDHPDQCTQQQMQLAAEAEELLQVTHEEVARKIAAPQRTEAKKLAAEATKLEEQATYTRRYRDIVNFLYWRRRAELEQTDAALGARKFIYQGDQAFHEGDLVAARDAYEQGLTLWRKVLDKYPALLEDEITCSDLMDLVKQYRNIYNQLDEPFPENFILQDIVDKFEKNR